MVTVVAGLRGTSDFGTDERPKNFRELILWRNPNGTAPLFALMSRMKTESTDDPEFNWWTEPNDIVRLEVDAVVATTGTTITIEPNMPGSSTGLSADNDSVFADATVLVPGDVLQVESTETTGAAYNMELVVVSSVTDSTTFVVKRGQAGTSAAAPIGVSTFLTKIGNAFAEGTGAPQAASRNPTKYYNLCQIFKTTYDLTNTTLATRFRTGDPLRNDKKRKMFDHSAALEMAFLWGRRHETVGGNGKPLRYTGGLRQFIPPARSTIFTTTPTIDNFLDATFRVFDWDTGAGNERIVFTGNRALNSLNKLAKEAGQVQYVEEVKFFGMSLSRWRIPQGDLLIKVHPLMNRHGVYQNSMFVVDPTAIIYRPLRGRDTHFKDNIQANDEDRKRGQWLTEGGIEVQYGGLTQAYIGNFVV